jgi:threonine/homoserine/homoserine lactone efflux protein
MAYKDMNQATYLIVTLSLYLFELVCACFINDISTVFDFTSAVAASAITFWYPASYYLLAEKRYGKYNRYSHCMAWFLNCFGVFNFLLGMATGILSITH